MELEMGTRMKLIMEYMGWERLCFLRWQMVGMIDMICDGVYWVLGLHKYSFLDIGKMIIIHNLSQKEIFVNFCLYID